MTMGTRIPAITLDKPAFGHPCNGCGTCCIEEVCELGRELGDTERCLALVAFNDGSYGCGLILNPYQYLPSDRLVQWQRIDAVAGSGEGEQALKNYFLNALGAGLGCDSPDS